jgi:hypothetical protein
VADEQCATAVLAVVAVDDSGEQLQRMISVEPAAVDTDQQAVVDTGASEDMCLSAAVPYDNVSKLPSHLMLDPDCHGWRCSTDMTHRADVFFSLSEMAMFDSQQPDRKELMQCVEFELYSTATDLAEYHDMNTVQQRAEAVYDTVKSQVQQRTAAAAAERESLDCGSSSSAGADSAQCSDAHSTQYSQSNAVSVCVCLIITLQCLLMNNVIVVTLINRGRLCSQQCLRSSSSRSSNRQRRHQRWQR